jgi:hypothetical protein
LGSTLGSGFGSALIGTGAGGTAAATGFGNGGGATAPATPWPQNGQNGTPPASTD